MLKKSPDEKNKLFLIFLDDYGCDRDVIKEFKKRSEYTEISLPKWTCELFQGIMEDLDPVIDLDYVEPNSIRRESNYRVIEKLKYMDFDKDIIDFLHSEAHRLFLNIAWVMDIYLVNKFGIDEKRKKKIRTRRTGGLFSFGKQIDAFY